jgi:ATP phosphoribosyltransferase
MALPKGRLFDNVRELFAKIDIPIDFENRELISRNDNSGIDFFLVKNNDLPTYVHHGIAGLGVCGEDVLFESGHSFVKLHRMPFGSTKICLAGKAGESGPGGSILTVASKFTRFTKDFFHKRNIPVQIIKLNGSVELAPLLGLAPYIVDLVETGSTLKANNLAVIEELAVIEVYLIANPAYYKLNYKKINHLIELLKKE